MSNTRLTGIELIQRVEKACQDGKRVEKACQDGKIGYAQFKKLMADHEIHTILLGFAEKHDLIPEFIALSTFSEDKFKMEDCFEEAIKQRNEQDPQNKFSNPLLLVKGKLTVLRDLFNANVLVLQNEQANELNSQEKSINQDETKSEILDDASEELDSDSEEVQSKAIDQANNKTEANISLYESVRKLPDNARLFFQTINKPAKPVEFIKKLTKVRERTDGSYIRVEHFNIYSMNEQLATSLTITSFTNENNKVVSELLSRKVYVLNEAGNELFDENFKRYVVPRYNQSKSVRDEIKHEVNFYLTTSKEEKFNLVLNELEKVAHEDNDSLSTSARDIVSNTRAAYYNKVHLEELPKLTKFLESTTELIRTSRSVNQQQKSSVCSKYINQAINTYRNALEDIASINRWKRIVVAGAIFLENAIKAVSTFFGFSRLSALFNVKVDQKNIYNIYTPGENLLKKAEKFKNNLPVTQVSLFSAPVEEVVQSQNDTPFLARDAVRSKWSNKN